MAKLAGDVTKLIKESLNLDIDRDTKERINAVADGILENMKDGDLPEEITAKTKTAATNLKETKKRYDTALENGNTKTTKNAEKDFKAAQKNLATAEKEMETYKNEVADLLKEAITDLYREGRDGNLFVKFKMVQAQVSEKYSSSDKILLIDFEEIDLQEEGEIELQASVNEAEIGLATYLFAQILIDDEPVYFESFLTRSKEIDIAFTAIVTEMRAEGRKNKQIMEALKKNLKKAFATILIPEL